MNDTLCISKLKYLSYSITIFGSDGCPTIERREERIGWRIWGNLFSSPYPVLSTALGPTSIQRRRWMTAWGIRSKKVFPIWSFKGNTQYIQQTLPISLDPLCLWQCWRFCWALKLSGPTPRSPWGMAALPAIIVFSSQHWLGTWRLPQFIVN